MQYPIVTTTIFIFTDYLKKDLNSGIRSRAIGVNEVFKQSKSCEI